MMSLKTLLASCFFAGLIAHAADAAPITFDSADLTGGTAAADFSSVTATQGGVTLTATATEGGAIRHYTQGSGAGLYIGAITSGAFNTNANTSAPASGRYSLGFDQTIDTISFTFDWLTQSGAGQETVSEFATNLGAIALTAADFTTGTGTSFDVTNQVINTTVGRGSGTVSYTDTNGFNAFSFFHEQAPRNIGFTITSVTVDVSAVPLPAGLPLLLVGLGGFAMMRRRQNA